MLFEQTPTNFQRVSVFHHLDPVPNLFSKYHGQRSDILSESPLNIE